MGPSTSNLSTSPPIGPQRPEWLLPEVGSLPSPPSSPGPGPEGRGTPLCCSQNFGPDALVLDLLLCLLSCVRPPDICHLFSVKFSCKVSQCVVPDDQHVTLPGCSQIAFSSFIHVGFPRKALAAREESMPFSESRCEREHWMRSEDYR